jgi:hypothetical protein
MEHQPREENDGKYNFIEMRNINEEVLDEKVERTCTYKNTRQVNDRRQRKYMRYMGRYVDI